MGQIRREDKIILPPNFSTEDTLFAVSQGAHIVDTRYYSYITNVSEALHRKIDILWAIDSTQK